MEGPIRDRAALLESANSALRAEIAAHREVAEALRESEELFRTLAECLPHLVWTCRADGRCDYLSRQWAHYAGCSAVETPESGWMEYLHPDDHERVKSAWEDATERGDAFDADVRIRRADGQYRWFKSYAVPLGDASRRIGKWVGFHTDIEDSRQAHFKVAAQLERLRLLDRITRAIGERQDLHSIIDVTALDVLDSFATRTIRGIAYTARLRGAATVVVGIQPDVAIALVQLGLTLEDIATALDLEEGIGLLREIT